jgi:hypothetical protein
MGRIQGRADTESPKWFLFTDGRPGSRRYCNGSILG